GDVFAGAPHDVLLAVEEVEHAGVVLGDDVAGLEPVVFGPGGVCGLFVLEVAGEEAASRVWVVAAQPEFAVRVGFGVVAVIVDYAGFQVLAGAAEGAGVDGPWFGGGDEAAAGLGHAPEFQQRKAEALLERAVQRRFDPGADAEAHAVVAL